MPIVYSASDTVEPIADTDAEAFGNAHLYGVISGCAVTYNAATMQYDVAAGLILHNGSVVSVAAQANAGTLVADGTNPRWATIYLDSSGVEGLVHGTAAADPSKPETGDNVAIAMVLIEAGQTIANNISVKLDKRVWTHSPVKQYKYKTATQDFTATTTYADITATSGNIAFSVAANTAYHLKVMIHWSAVGTAGGGGLKFQLTGPASPTRVASVAKATSYIADYDGVSTVFQRTGAKVQGTSGTTFTELFSMDAYNTAGSGTDGLPASGAVEADVFIINGANAGTVTLQGAQNTSGGTSTVSAVQALIEQISAAA